MNETIDITLPTTENSYKKYFPILTAICCMTSIILFIGINLEGKPDTWTVYKKWGSPSVTDIFNGSYWGLISSNFLHTELWHIAPNLYWLYIFGKKIEFESKKTFYGLLIISAAIVCSLSEFSFANTSGIGLSGIGYCLLGFIIVKSKTTDAYKNFLEKRTTRLFVFWLFLCVILTQTKAWNVGNEAHISGILWGMTLAYLSKFVNSRQWTVGILLVAVLVSSTFFSPFSTSWLSHQAFELHKIQKVEEAMTIYKKILQIKPGNEFAKINLKKLEIHKLQEKANKLHTSQQYKEARQVYNELLSIDPNEQWAIDNLKILPND